MSTIVDEPLSATLERLAAANDDLVADIGDIEGDWFAAADLWNPSLPLLAKGLEIAISGFPGAKIRAAGSFLTSHYAWYLLTPAIATYLTEDRVPDIDPSNVAVRNTVHRHEEENGEVHEHSALAVRFLSGRFAALPSDPDAAHPDAVIVPDRAALREWLRVRLEQHIAPLIDAVYESTRLGKRAQWNLTADASARLFQWIGSMIGAEPRGCEEGLSFVKAPGSPLLNRDTGFITLEYAGHKETFTTRGGCCLYHTVPGGERCHTCVLHSDEERNEILLTYMAQKYAESVPA